MELVEFICFGATPHNGSDALLVCGPDVACWTPEERHAFTVAQHAHACVFVDKDPQGGPASLDFYYPHMRSPLCVHASIAAAHYLWSDARSDGTLAVVTAMHRQPLLFQRDNDDVYVSIDPASVVQPEISPRQIAALLHCDDMLLIGTPIVASVGSAKLLVEVPSRDVLRSLQPDLEAIVAWGRAHSVNGFYVYTRVADGEVEGRNFNHLDARIEDTATGVAAGALSVALNRGLTVYQGEVQDNPCVLRTSLSNGKVKLGGRVVRKENR